MNINHLRLLQGAAGKLIIILAAGILAGCQSPPAFAEWAGAPGSTTNGATVVTNGGSEILQPGELISIEIFTSASQPPFQPYEERIKEDGTITPPMLGPVVADGKRPGELQKELQKEYEKLFVNPTVVLTTAVRVFWVDGEVTKPGPQTYLGDTDIMKAISAAGGFNNFENRRRVHLIHPDGSKEIVNYNKALNDPTLNRAVYPGDKIWVPRRLFW
jgi:polysaccharide export outer membrane protein